MTGADDRCIATTRRNLPALASSGIVAPWTGAALREDGSVLCPGRREAAALALGACEEGDDPVVLTVRALPTNAAQLVPWTAVDAILVASDHAKHELEARAYDNFDPSERPVLVTPEDFDVTPAGGGLGAVGAPAGLDLIDQCIGAAACASCVPVPSEIAVLRDRVVQDIVSSDGSPAALLAALEPLLTPAEDDRRLMAAAAEAARGLDPSAPLGGRRFIGDLTASTGVLDPRTDRALEAVLEVLKAKKELNPLRDDVGLRSVKALLLFTLRPDPYDAVTWAEEMPADPLSVVTAVLLAGLRSGWTRLPVALRGAGDARGWFECRLADAAGPELWMEGRPPVAGALLDETPPDSPDLVTEEPVSSPEAPPAKPSVEGDPPAKGGLIEQIRFAARHADLQDADVARAAAAVCLKHGWEELVTTVLAVGRRPFTWTGAEIEVTGVPTLQRRIDPKFLDNLDDFGGRVSAELRAFGSVLGVEPRRRTGGKTASRPTSSGPPSA